MVTLSRRITRRLSGSARVALAGEESQGRARSSETGYDHLMTNKKVPSIPSTEFVLTSGDGLERTGLVVSGLGTVLGILLLVTSGSPVLLGLIPIGLLLMITGYTKESSTANVAAFILEMERFEASYATDGRTHQPPAAAE